MKAGHILAVLFCATLLVAAWFISNDTAPLTAQSPVSPIESPTVTPTSSGEWYDVCPVDLEITATPYVQPTYTPQATYTPEPVPTCRATVVAVISGPSPTPYPTQTPYPTATPWPAQP